MPRLLFLALQAPGLSPGQRYRFEAFEPYLRSRGFQIETAWLLDRDDLSIFYGNARLRDKARLAARAALRRLHSVLPLGPRPDVVFVQREAFFLFGAWSEWLAHLRAPLVFDLDDAIWLRTVSEGNLRFAAWKNVAKMPRIAGLAHTVIAGNEHLASWARRYSRNVHVIPTSVDTDHFTPPPSRSRTGPITIGWSGSASTLAHLRPLLPVLERVQARYGERVRLRVMGAPFEHAPLRLRAEPWSPTAELAFLRDMHIGIMPLPDDEWSLGKCGLKGLLAMAVGAATVMSPVGVACNIVHHGENGLLARADDDWEQALSTLIEDAELRERLGSAGRRTVVEKYSVADWAEKLANLLLEASQGPRVGQAR